MTDQLVIEPEARLLVELGQERGLVYEDELQGLALELDLEADDVQALRDELAQLGIHLDHFTGSQWNAGPHVAESDLAPGDLVFFEPYIGHVGIYIGNGEFIHAPHTGTVVQISSLSDAWYSAEYQGAVRVTG